MLNMILTFWFLGRSIEKRNNTWKKQSKFVQMYCCILLKAIIKNWLMAILWPKPLIGIFYIPKLFVHWLRFSRTDGAPKIKFSDF
jgi:hypothetical protein